MIIEIIKKACYFVIIGLFMLLSDSAFVLALSSIVCSLVALIVNCIPNIKLIGYTIPMLIKDLGINLLSAIVMGTAVIGLGVVLPAGSVDSDSCWHCRVLCGSTNYKKPKPTVFGKNYKRKAAWKG